MLNSFYLRIVNNNLNYNIMTSKKIRFTENGNSYWNNSGAYQKEYNKLFKEMVPSSGESDTVHGELIRAVSRLTYEYCNNGNCNACDVTVEEVESECSNCNGWGHLEGRECYECDGSGYIYDEEETSREVTKFYQAFIDFISENLCGIIGKKEVDELARKVESVITGDSDDRDIYFGYENMNVYTKMTDYVIWFVVNYPEFNRPYNK